MLDVFCMSLTVGLYEVFRSSYRWLLKKLLNN
nr:MAG TPA: hypothetical protein [Caudoviricetes sp.]